MNDWLPIADAPRNGTVVAVSYVRANRGGRHIEKCKWSKHYWSTPYFRNRFAGGIVEPTNFMLLNRKEGDL